MVQPDIVKMGGITGLLRCAALAHAHGVELVPHQTQPTIGHTANLHVAAAQLHATKPASGTTRRRARTRCSRTRPGRWTGCSMCRASRGWGCG